MVNADIGTMVGAAGILLHTTSGGVVGIEAEALPPLPRDFSLAQNYPNPFYPVTTIHYQLSGAAEVSLIVYDLLGRPVKQLAAGRRQSAGSYSVQWNGTDESGRAVSSGVYFYQLRIHSSSRESGNPPLAPGRRGSTAATGQQSRKMMLLR